MYGEPMHEFWNIDQIPITAVLWANLLIPLGVFVGLRVLLFLVRRNNG